MAKICEEHCGHPCGTLKSPHHGPFLPEGIATPSVQQVVNRCCHCGVQYGRMTRGVDIPDSLVEFYPGWSPRQ